MLKKIILLSFLLVITGCAGLDLSKDEWNALSDRKFYVTEFKYIHPGKDTKYAFETMKEFPLKKLMYIISRNYNVEIDMSDFQSFLNHRRQSDIKTHGFFKTTNFTWSLDNKNYSNTIKIVFEKDYMEESQMKYKMIAESEGKTLKSFEISFTRFEMLFNQMKYYFSDTEKFISEFEKENYSNSETVPGLYFGKTEIIDNKTTSKEEEIKMILDDYVKTLDEEQKKKFKHEIIDHIYKICE